MLRRGHHPRREAGDTLIEVLFATTVFSLIVVSALALMNQGSAVSQRALETSLVRQQIDNQAEALRFLHESYVTNYQPGFATNANLKPSGPTGEFYKIVQAAKAANVRSASSLDEPQCPSTPPTGSFIINTRTGVAITNPASFERASTYAQLSFDTVHPTVLQKSSGLWIEAIRSTNSSDPLQSNAGYIDFYIRGCWDAPGLNRPMNMGTIVRLYEPRG